MIDRLQVAPMLLRPLFFALALAIATGSGALPGSAAVAAKRHYWATSLAGSVHPPLMRELRAAVARGDTGWVDIDPSVTQPPRGLGVDLILYHVGGNCYLGRDCKRFPFAQTTGTRWDVEERAIDLSDSAVRKIVIADLIAMLQRADKSMPARSRLGVHVDNVHRLDDAGIAALFNDFLGAVELAKRERKISRQRVVGYIGKNNPRAFKQALDRKLLLVRPFYQIVENATLDEHGALDPASELARAFGRQYGIPVFLKTFGSDVAYRKPREEALADPHGSDTPVSEARVSESPVSEIPVSEVHVSPAMTARMAQLPAIAGSAWSADEGNYHPTFFVQGSAVPESPLLLEGAE